MQSEIEITPLLCQIEGMKKTKLFLLGAVGAISLTGCGSVVPVAEVAFKQEGSYIYYSADAYGVTEGHIQVYETQEKAQEQYAIPDIDIRFWPRICGAYDETIDGETFRTTLVDLSKKSVIMDVTVYKDSVYYAETKQFYINDAALVATRTNSLDTLISYTFEGIKLTRTNPGGRWNSITNWIEYK